MTGIAAGMEPAQSKKSIEKISIWLILAIGILLRVLYTVYTSPELRSHDLWELSPDAAGKAGYILHIMEYGKLPDSYELQYYQQPLYYVISAMACSASRIILGLEKYSDILKAAQFVSCLASCGMLLLMSRLAECFGLRGRGKIIAIFCTAFAPVFILTSGRVGEEALLYFFMVLAVLYSFYFAEEPGAASAFRLGLIYGLGTLIKISMLVCLIFTAYIVFQTAKKVPAAKWEQDTKSVQKTKVFSGMLWSGFVFLITFVPVGCSFSMRNLLLFGQPIGYVLPQNPDGPLYVGGESFVMRFLSFDFRHFLQSPYADVYEDYNLPSYLLKTELFGEFSYDFPGWIPIVMLLLNMVLTLLCLWTAVRCRHTNGELIVLTLGFIAFAVWANLRYPFGCTMDFRYYAMLAVCKAIWIGKFVMKKEYG